MNEEKDVLMKQMEQLREDLFLAQTDLENAKTENIALKNFIQNIYESCEELGETEISLDNVLCNLKKNIQIFSKAHRIRL
ncbi:MAG: hypothetical protein AAF620_10260 [Bacteroidota bacterium]